MDKELYKNRRIFLSENKKYFQLFDFIQSNDGSIYSSWPNFENTEWLEPVLDKNNQIKIKKIRLNYSGKLSMHASGMFSFRSHENLRNRPLIIRGNKLLNLNRKKISARHLFTIYTTKPFYLPENSPAFNRKSDYIINNSIKLEPHVFIFFAIPKTKKRLKIQLESSFDINYLEKVPPVLGFGIMPLKYHDICWYSYRTKHMTKWPNTNKIIFNDGFIIPIFLGTKIKKLEKLKLTLIKPNYILKKNNFIIKFHIT
jgi:hypothetical protein